MPEYPLSDLTEKIIGCLFTVFKDLKYGYQEKYYQRAFELELKRMGIPYKRELKRTIDYNGNIIGRYFVDFLVDDKVAVELKVADGFYESHIKQLLAYLKTFNVRIGLLTTITKDGVKVKRLIN